MNVILKELLLSIPRDLPWLIKGHLNQVHSLMFFQVKQVFYSEVPGKAGWSYIIRYDPRGRPVKYNVVEEEDNVEEEGDADQEQLDVDIDVSDEESDQ